MDELLISWFLISIVLGVGIGLEAFKLLYRSEAQRLALSTRLGCAFGGAFLGTFGGVLLTLGFQPLASFPNNYYATTLLATIMAVGLQKFHAGQEAP